MELGFQPQSRLIYLPEHPSRSTGKERDLETQLDYFGARYYTSNIGRWMSPDWSARPAPVPYADYSDPQTLNLYGYVRNNPLSHADADGHCCDAWKALWNHLSSIVSAKGTVGIGFERSRKAGVIQAKASAAVKVELSARILQPTKPNITEVAEISASVGAKNVGKAEMNAVKQEAGIVENGKYGPTGFQDKSSPLTLNGPAGSSFDVTAPNQVAFGGSETVPLMGVPVVVGGEVSVDLSEAKSTWQSIAPAMKELSNDVKNLLNPGQPEPKRMPDKE